MKTIIISDIHNRTSWIEQFLSEIPHDRVIFLGDYFDDFYDTYNDIVRTAEWLKKSIRIPNRIHLFGNHDLWYRNPHNLHIMCSGNTLKKAQIINDILTPIDWSRLKLYHFEQNFLFTHAGLHQIILKNLSIHDIPIAAKIALNDAKCDVQNPWIEPGIARGGQQEVGGITWLDWHMEFEPIPNINQIAGHTPLQCPEEIITNNSINYCLDTHNQHIGILENGKFKTIENNFLEV